MNKIFGSRLNFTIDYVIKKKLLKKWVDSELWAGEVKRSCLVVLRESTYSKNVFFIFFANFFCEAILIYQ